jgi:hypothetical protein
VGCPLSKVAVDVAGAGNFADVSTGKSVDRLTDWQSISSGSESSALRLRTAAADEP